MIWQKRAWGCAPNPFFDLLVRWEYAVVPKHRFRKFAVVSDRQRYNQLVAGLLVLGSLYSSLSEVHVKCRTGLARTVVYFR